MSIKIRSFLTALLITAISAQAPSQKSPEVTGKNNCNLCVDSKKPYMYCPDGSCESQEDSTCSTDGPIYTKATGCKAT